MLERPNKGERAILLHIAPLSEHIDDGLQEIRELASSAGAVVVGELVVKEKREPSADLYIGHGKAEELAELVNLHKAEIVIFNYPISPAQERNLEKIIKCRVIDRAGLILDIFAQRAISFEGKLQVELAQLKHMSTRLIRGWTHLERQKGGIGLRGPGETQLELDRRIIRDKIQKISERLEKVKKQRTQSRLKRQRNNLPTVALVGYTNVGKSSLFNTLTKSNALVANKLFATLDPTWRALELQSIGKVILVDTVGFVRDLPHELIEAFKATLEETTSADLLLHVIDASDSKRDLHKQQVDKVLSEIGVQDIPVIEVYNKADLLINLNKNLPKSKYYSNNGNLHKIWVSAEKNLNLDDLKLGIISFLSQDKIDAKVILTSDLGRLRGFLYAKSAVISEKVDKKGNWVLDISLRRSDWQRACSYFPELINNVVIKD